MCMYCVCVYLYVHVLCVCECVCVLCVCEFGFLYSLNGFLCGLAVLVNRLDEVVSVLMSSFNGAATEGLSCVSVYICTFYTRLKYSGHV